MLLRSLLTALGMTTAVAAAVLTGPTSPAAAATGPTYLTSPWSGLITSRTLSDNGIESCHDLGHDEWVALGSPTPQQVPARLGQVPGQPDIWWQTTQCRFSFSDHHLTLAEWQALGAPAPVVTLGTIDGFHVARFGSNPSELFVGRGIVWNDQTPFRKLNYAEWVAGGSPAPQDMLNRFFRVSWDPAVFTSVGTDRMSGYQVSYAAWVQGGAPTPEVFAQRIPGDRFVVHPGSRSVVYHGPGIFWETLTYAQWQAAGAPAPTVCTLPEYSC